MKHFLLYKSIIGAVVVLFFLSILVSAYPLSSVVNTRKLLPTTEYENFDQQNVLWKPGPMQLSTLYADG